MRQRCETQADDRSRVLALDVGLWNGQAGKVSMTTNKHSSETGKAPNRLAYEKSPYLLQHAYNPVDWYPWGEEAFQKARLEDKPIFLSIGYSTCYWCHVMERQVFENESIAAMMNRELVCVKVDREERPDIDRVYMSALQAMTGSGGWPMSMFLTPDLKPFFGATYIPPTDQFQRPGFPQIVERILEVWTTDRSQVHEVGERMLEYLRQMTHSAQQPIEANQTALDACFDYFRDNYDSVNGGFGNAPKFPRPAVLNLLLRYFFRTKNQQALEMTLTTLRAMANGGMHDHIGGGFHRYATDERWHVPHFEKMLYDQAQLVVSYLEAFQITHEDFFANVARDTCDYVLRDLSHPEGGFYSAEDAESAPHSSDPNHKEEGAYYVWTRSEIDNLLAPHEAEVFVRHFGIEENGNVIADPHELFKGKNVVHVIASITEVAKQLKFSETEIANALTSSRSKLFAARTMRPHCHLDDKILTSWNGLMISALARASQVLSDQRYLEAAEKSARFILNSLLSVPEQRLLHRFRDGEARFDGQLDDYAFFVQALIDLYEASFGIDWLSKALALTDQLNSHFYDQENGGYFDTTGQDTSVLVRTKEWYDGAEPSGNSIAILNLLRLAQFTDNETYGQMAQSSLRHFGDRLSKQPHATPQFLVALDMSLSKPSQIVIAGNSDDPLVRSLLQEVHSHYLPNKILMLADGKRGQHFLTQFVPFMSSIKMVGGIATAFVCENYACQLPTTDRKILSMQLGR
jgi:uncharacterized protein